MKKLISILLVAMLVIGMFPAIVNAADTQELTISMSKQAATTSISTTQRVDELEDNEGNTVLTVTNDKAESSTEIRNNTGDTHARWYIGNTVTIDCADMTKIVFNCVSSYVIPQADIAGCSVSGTTVTLEFAEPTDSYTFSISKQSRVTSIVVTQKLASGCDHTAVEQSDGKEATCEETGLTNSWVCSKCGETTVSQKEIPVVDHEYVDGKCTMCGQAKPQDYVLIDLSEDGFYEDVVFVATKDGATYALPSTEATSNGSVVVQSVNVTNDVLENNGLDNLKWDITVTNGKMTFQPADSTDKYLYCTNNNNGVRVSSSSDHEGYDTFVIDQGYLKNEGRGRYLGVYLTQDWRCYTSHTQANIANQTFAFYALEKAAVEETKDYVSDDEIGYDSIEEALKAGSTTLKSTTGAEMPFQVDVTVGNTTTTYIGLEDGDYYTYYELTLKMSSISLRASDAGIYYSAKVDCEDTLAQAVDSYGIVLSTNDMPAELEATDNAFTVISGPIDTTKTINSGSVFNIFDESLEDSVNTTRGTVPIYAAVYLEIDGQVVISKQETSWSLQKVVKTIDSAIAEGGQLYGKLKPDQEDALRSFYIKWAVENEVINGWSVSNIGNLCNG